MQHDVKLKNCPFIGPFSPRKIQQENSSFRTTTKVYQDHRTSIKSLIHPTKLLLGINVFHGPKVNLVRFEDP